MNMLYDSDSFVVVHIQAEVPPERAAHAPLDGIILDGASTEAERTPTLIRHGFEIVDKRSGKEIYLDGQGAEHFQQQLLAWQQRTPSQDEVEDTLERYAAYAQTRVVLH